MTRNQKQNRRQAVPRPKQTAKAIAAKERRAFETLQSIGYQVVQQGPFAYFIVRKAG